MRINTLTERRRHDAIGPDTVPNSSGLGAGARPGGPTDDPVLLRFRAAIENAYGDRIARIVLFGSRARGDAHADSDYDIGLFLNDMGEFDREAQILASIETDLLTATGAVVNTLPLPACALADRTGWMQEVRRDGVAL